MCGILGWIDHRSDLREQKPVLKRMCQQLAVRGPDAEGYWITTGAAIGHRRLTVVDPEGGKQPMIREHAGRTYVLTYNGELYNTAEIREELEKLGHRFLSYSDTEVLLVAFIEWGKDCLKYLNGIFAFGVWDDGEHKLFLARDRMGVKPLFYTELNGTLMFASEIKALLANDMVKPEVDAVGLAEIFGLGPARTPGSGVFRGIRELPPGCWLEFCNGQSRIGRYWQLESKPHEDNFQTTVERVRYLVVDAVERQLVSDVPIGSFLSGGLDSSIIAAIAARRLLEDKEVRLPTFSLDYQGNAEYFKSSLFQPNADRPWVEQMVQAIGSESHWVELGQKELADALEPAVLARDVPGMADIDSSLWLFCRRVKEHVTVALSGECADEVFGGYPWFHHPERVNGNSFPWSTAYVMWEKIFPKNVKKKLKLSDYVNERYMEALKSVPRLPGESPVEARRRELFYLNLNWFMVMLLERKDRMSMASGLEVRVPFCDHRLVEYVWNIPWEWKCYGGREKGILRQAVQDLLPEEVLMRKKSPYPKTHHPEYLALVTERWLKVVADSHSPLRELIDVNAVFEWVQRQGIDKPWFGQLMAGPQLLAYLIQIDTWLKHYQINILI